MRVLVIGSGAREHALLLALSRDPQVDYLAVAPGNAGTALDASLSNLALNAIPDLVSFAREQNIAFTVVGPEAPLAAGVVDAFRAAGLRIFGPTQYAAQLESSKDFAKAFMQRHGIPTAGYQTFTDAAAARAYVDGKGAPIVIKADGLAAGKGVVVAMTLAEAHAAIDDMLLGNKMGALINWITGVDLPNDASEAMKSLTHAGAAFFNQRFPAGVPEQACGEGAHVVLGDTGNSYQGLCGMIRRKTRSLSIRCAQASAQ